MPQMTTVSRIGTLAICASVAAPLHAGPLLLEGAFPDPYVTAKTDVGAFQSDPPWTIGVSHFDFDADIWTQQVRLETLAAAEADRRISEIVLLDAQMNDARQAADIATLIDREVDAIIISPVSTSSAAAGIENATAQNIPVITHTGDVGTDATTVRIDGGGVPFGYALGDWLVQTIGAEGKIWVLRGPEGHSEVDLRYQGLSRALEGTDIDIAAEVFADWRYAPARAACELLFASDPAVDGIWSSGAEMTRACVDVFKENGAEIPPITGEVNNGFFGQWLDDGFPSVAAVYSPAQGAAALRAAVALLEGAPLHSRYIYAPEPWDAETAAQFYRADLSDDVWWPSTMTEGALQAYYGEPSQ